MTSQRVKNRELGSLDPWLKVVSGEIFLSLCLLVNLCLPGSQGMRRAEVEHVEANELTG